jgi:hypothetical protein
MRRKCKMAYRYYSNEVQEGYVDFNDETYHIMDTHRMTDNTTLAIIFHEPTASFQVVKNLKYHDLNSISFEEAVDPGFPFSHRMDMREAIATFDLLVEKDTPPVIEPPSLYFKHPYLAETKELRYAVFNRIMDAIDNIDISQSEMRSILKVNALRDENEEFFEELDSLPDDDISEFMAENLQELLCDHIAPDTMGE